MVMSENFRSVIDRLEVKYYVDMKDAYYKGFTEGYAKAKDDAGKSKKFDKFESFGRGYKAGMEDMKNREYEQVTDGVFPKPCDGPLFDDWGAGDYMEKIREEFDELVDAFQKWRKKPSPETVEQLYLESTDTIVAVTGLMEKAGCNKRMRANYMRRVNYSNSQRDGGKRFKDNADYVTPEEKQEIRREIYEDMGEYDET